MEEGSVLKKRQIFTPLKCVRRSPSITALEDFAVRRPNLFHYPKTSHRYSEGRS